MRLQGTTAIVTGAASGLGAATAEALVAQGARVFALDLNAPQGAHPEGITYLSADVTDVEQVRAAVAEAATEGTIRVVVSCAGIAPTAPILGPDGVHDLAMYAKVIGVNLIGTFNVLALAAEAIAATEPLEHGQRGVIVNTASVAAYDGQGGQSAYSSSKGGVTALTLPAALDLAQYGIRVNTIAPGIIETPMLGMIGEEGRASLGAYIPFPARLGRPDEFAQLVCAIIAHDYLNGETIRMDGALRLGAL